MRINWISDSWKRVKNHCRTTVNKEFTDNEPTNDFKKNLLISEHSPIRLLEIDWTWEQQIIVKNIDRHRQILSNIL